MDKKVPVDMSFLYGRADVLSLKQVSEREGIPVQRLRYMCREGQLQPARLIGQVWIISEGYTFFFPNADPRGTGHIRPGRPKGSKNIYPYQKKN
jgi:hypothetical protein